ncbi:hypothetical protein ACIG54_24150 [Streptomyces achromogenes]|uniref:hypothetical protein n=1 Tax=Streptomyces achromogenes TaxID=67255 RepID=UPI0037CEB89F
MTLFITLLLGLMLVILGLTMSWPWWAWSASGPLLLITVYAIYRMLRPKRLEIAHDFLSAPDLPFPEAERQEHRITHVALPSSVADYDFSFSATVRWTVLDVPDDAPWINAAGLAVESVLERARAVAAQQPPNRSSLARHQLDGALATMRVDASGRVMAMAHSIELDLPEHDRERLARLSNVRKDEDVWEHERNYERSKRAYLGDDVLKDTGSAVVWWLSRNEEEVEGAVDRIGVFAQLSAAARNESVAPQFEHMVHRPGDRSAEAEPGETQLTPDSQVGAESTYEAEPPFPADSVLACFGISPDDPDRDLFATRLADVARAHGKHHAEAALRGSCITDDKDDGDGRGHDPEKPAKDECEGA